MLFKITHSSNFNTSIQALILIQQLSASKRFAEDRFYRTLYESLLDPRLVTSSKHAMYLNLLFRALKSDLNVKRVKAFAKRLLQVITLHQAPFVCGVLYLLRELEGTFPSLSSLFTSPEESDEAEEEIFLDVPEDAMEAASRPKSPQDSQVYPDREFIAQINRNGYDGRKRDPEHSNADRSCFWELVSFEISIFVMLVDTHLASFRSSFSPFCVALCITAALWQGNACKARSGFTHPNSLP
jgi:ribosome biogenesis protein MAK21